MTRITFAIPSLRGGGAEFVTREWANYLTARGHDVTIVLTAHEADEPVVSSKVVLLGARGTSRRRQFSRLRAYIRSERPQIVVGMMTRTNFQVLAANLSLRVSHRAKVVISERNMPFTEKDQSWLHVYARTKAIQLLYPRADLFLAISHPVGATFAAIAGLAATKIWLVPNPAIAKSGVEIRARRSSSASLSIVVPGRLVDKKRPLLALEVADALRDSVKDLRVIYFGEGPWRERLEAEKRAYPIELRGRVEHWFDEVPDDAVVLLPSAVEGFANVLVEAASRGVPSVVASSAFGSADAIIPGVTGVFARNDSVSEFVRAVEEASRLECATPVAWLENFSLTASTELLERAFESLAPSSEDAPR